MISFKPVSLGEKAVIDAYFRYAKVPICDFSFATVFCWRSLYKTEFAELHEHLILRYTDNGSWLYMPPVGKCDDNLRLVLQAIVSDARERNLPFRMGAATPELFEPMEKAMPGVFTFQENRDLFEYIYSAPKLATLSGKALQAKRNHVNHFLAKFPDFSAVPLETVFDECRAVYKAWENAHLKEYPDEDLTFEQNSVEEAFENFQTLGLQGIALKISGETIAFAYGEKILSNTFVVHAEKTHPDFREAFVMINKLTASHLASDCEFINREEDMGIESLRNAKMQYHPVRFLQKGTVELKNP